ncbi:MAG: hypothetical protein R3254_05150 [Thiomicrorhabdus sp.]|nr:hypothetical protein [Thiomicrorhabdus sp.]
MSKVYEEICSFGDNPFSHWSLFSNQVRMAGSQQTIDPCHESDLLCGCLFGTPESETNRNLLPIEIDLSDINQSETLSQTFAAYDGVVVDLDTAGQPYQLRFKSKSLWFPWQWFSKTIDTDQKQPVFIPFTAFKGHFTWARFNPEKVSNLQIVLLAKGHVSTANIKRLGVYRNG